MIVDIDLNKVLDQFCSVCGEKKRKFISRSLGVPSVMFESTCNCNRLVYRKSLKSEKEIFDELQTPFWKIAGMKPKPHEQKLERLLKWKNMSWGDYRRYRDHLARASHPSAMPRFENHIKKYKWNNEPAPSFTKKS